jgi:hypothetical protein
MTFPAERMQLHIPPAQAGDRYPNPTSDESRAQISQRKPKRVEDVLILPDVFGELADGHNGEREALPVASCGPF